MMSSFNRPETKKNGLPVSVCSIQAFISPSGTSPTEMLPLASRAGNNRHTVRPRMQISPRILPEWRSLVVEDGHDVVAKCHPTDGEFIVREPMAVLCRSEIGGQKGGIAGGFREAVTMVDGKPKSVFEGNAVSFNNGPAPQIAPTNRSNR